MPRRKKTVESEAKPRRKKKNGELAAVSTLPARKTVRRKKSKYTGLEMIIYEDLPLKTVDDYIEEIMEDFGVKEKDLNIVVTEEVETQDDLTLYHGSYKMEKTKKGYTYSLGPRTILYLQKDGKLTVYISPKW